MKHAELVEEMLKRELPLRDKITRPQMIIAIRDDVAMRNTLYATANQSSKPTGGEEDCNMEDPHQEWQRAGADRRLSPSRMAASSSTARKK